MAAMASQITSLTIVYSTVHSGADQRKHQSSASLAFVRGVHRWPVNSPHKWPVTRKKVFIWWRHHEIVRLQLVSICQKRLLHSYLMTITVKMWYIMTGSQCLVYRLGLLGSTGYSGRIIGRHMDLKTAADTWTSHVAATTSDLGR